MFGNLKIRTVVLLFFGIITTVFLATAVLFTASLLMLKKHIMANEQILKNVETSKQIQINLAESIGKILQGSIMNEDEHYKESEEYYMKTLKNIDALAGMNRDNREILNRLDSLKSEISILWKKGQVMYETYKVDKKRANELMDEYHPVEDKIMDDVQLLVDEIHHLEEAGNSMIFSMLQRTIVIIIASTFAVILFIVLISISTAGNLTMLIKNFSMLFEKGVSGDFTARYREKKKSGNEISMLGMQFNKFLTALNDNFIVIKKMSGEIEKCSDQTSNSSLQLASASEEQSRNSESIQNNMNNFNYL